jgi:flagellar FliJ protein
MHAPDTETLTTLLEREQAARDAAALALQRCEQALERARAQADQLVQYRSEYIARWSAHFNRQAAIEIVHCYRSFMQRLDQALAQQQALVERQTSATSQARATLLDTELRAAAVKKLIARRVEDHARTVARRDQKQTDEAAQHAGWMSNQRGGLTALW